MTEVVDDLRLGFDFLCHCEEAVRRGNLGEVSFNRNFPSSAAKRLPRACGPRNDRCSRWSAPELRFPLSLRGAKRRGNPFFWQLVLVGTACTGYGLPRACGPRNDRCSRWSAPGLRFPLSLPRLLRSLAMTGGGGYGLLQYYSYVTKRPGPLQNEKPSIMIQLR